MAEKVESMTNSTIWIVKAEFENREDAIALIELASELGITAKLSSRSINSNTSPVRDTRAGKIVLKCMDVGRSYGYEHFFVALEEAGYDVMTAGPTLSRLTQQGDLRRVAHGIYQLNRKE